MTVTLGGTVTSYYQDVPPGATIVLLTIAAFVLLTALATPLARRRARAAAAAHSAGDPVECAIPATRGPPRRSEPDRARAGLAQWPGKAQT